MGINNTEHKSKPTKIEFFDFSKIKIIKLSTGYNHCICMNENNELFSWGFDDSGRLGLNDTNNRLIPTKIDSNLFDSKIIDFEACAYHSILFTQNSSLYTCGNNDYAQLGFNHTNKLTIPTKVDISNLLNNNNNNNNNEISLLTNSNTRNKNK